MLHKSSKNQNLELTILLFLTRNIFFQSTRVLLVRTNPAQVRLHKQQIYKAAATTTQTTLTPSAYVPPCEQRPANLQNILPSYMKLSKNNPDFSGSRQRSLYSNQKQIVVTFHVLIRSCQLVLSRAKLPHTNITQRGLQDRIKLRSFWWHRQAWMGPYYQGMHPPAQHWEH
jgi:hypothetical protein